MTDLALRQCTADDWPAIYQLLRAAFHETFDEDVDALERSVFEPDRSLGIFDDEAGDDANREADGETDGAALVAHAAAFTRDLTVPGATLAAAHVSLVAVAPTHRRRGLLTRLMHRQLADVAEAGEPVAVLWASEGQIYPRFGYGLASQRVSLSIDSREVRLPEPTEPGRLRVALADEVGPQLREVYEAVRADRPGLSSRDARWWSYRLADPPGRRRGGTERRVVLREGAAGPDGYAVWRSKGDWSPGGPEGEVIIDELVASNPDAALALWRFLLSIDLTRSARLWLGGPDEPLRQLANEPRRLGALLGDGLFVRIVDLPSALAVRRYAAQLDVVLEVADPLLAGNAGRWRLTADREKATCIRTGEPADLACGITELGAAYLGGTSLAALGGAGRVRELQPDTLAAASTAFGWHRAPAGIEIF